MNKNIKKCFALLITLVILISQVAFANNSHMKEDLETTLKEFSKTYKVPGLAAVITENNQIILSGSYGTNQTEIMTEDTPSYIASVSKSMTATAIMLACRRRKT